MSDNPGFSFQLLRPRISMPIRLTLMEPLRRGGQIKTMVSKQAA